MSKAQLAEDTLTYATVLVTIGLIAVIFFTKFSPEVTKKETIEGVELNSFNLMLLNYLRTPAEDGNIADFIVKSYHKNDFTKVEELTREIFSKIYVDSRFSWKIIVSKLPNQEQVALLKNKEEILEKRRTSIVLPMDKDSSLEVKLIEGEVFIL